MIPIVNMPKKPIKDAIPIKQTGIKDTIAVIKLPTKEKMEAPGKITRIKSAGLSIPDVILSRKNPVIKKIETDPGELIVELYDNGQVDGDTVSIYHNNELIVSHAGLSEKPVQFKIKVDANDPHHELIMVADNLGSIPPNTSLMIITTKGNRYEIFISSSEQQNAKLLIELKE
jgi:hypothetical protein